MPYKRRVPQTEEKDDNNESRYRGVQINGIARGRRRPIVKGSGCRSYTNQGYSRGRRTATIGEEAEGSMRRMMRRTGRLESDINHSQRFGKYQNNNSFPWRSKRGDQVMTTNTVTARIK